MLEFAGLISSCYCVIENVIEYLTQGPSMLLSEEQVLQLHAAMKGALNSVIWFLSKIDVEHPELVSPHVMFYCCTLVFPVMSPSTTYSLSI